MILIYFPFNQSNWLLTIRSLYNKQMLSLFAIDEAHCISDW